MKSGSQEGLGMGLVGRGFTMIEIVVVITIIAILTSLGLMVGNKVRLNSQVAATRSLIISLDQGYDSVRNEKGSSISGTWRDDRGFEFAVADAAAYAPASLPAPPLPVIVEPSQGLLLLASGQHPALKDVILRADPRYVTKAILTSNQDGFPTDNTVSVPVMKDAWGNPIRFVHPKWDNGYGPYWNTTTNAVVTSGREQERQVNLKRGPSPTSPSFTQHFVRSFRHAGGAVGIADEGVCVGGKGYFYSSGADKDPGLRDDNVYLDNPPAFASETAHF
jgi:prepilin-type N-terminal cleavage/methylation domain-containing protein